MARREPEVVPFMRIRTENCVGVIVDIQEKLLPHMFEHTEVHRNVLKLIQGLQVLGVPLMLTEQYPKGLGPTVGTVAGLTSGVHPISKMSFSCLDEPQFSQSLSALERKTVILAGIETHVCVLQTAVDLSAAGYTPVIIADCVSSRRRIDHETALYRLSAEDAIVSTCESVLFELCRHAGTETFRSISRLLK